MTGTRNVHEMFSARLLPMPLMDVSCLISPLFSNCKSCKSISSSVNGDLRGEDVLSGVCGGLEGSEGDEIWCDETMKGTLDSFASFWDIFVAEIFVAEIFVVGLLVVESSTFEIITFEISAVEISAVEISAVEISAVEILEAETVNGSEESGVATEKGWSWSCVFWILQSRRVSWVRSQADEINQ